MEDNLSRLFLDYNSTNTNTSNLFSFIDESNKYQNVGDYQKSLSKLITDYGPLILSESISQSCNINTTDKTTYISKLAELQNILNSCSLATNKEECFYNKFMNNNTLSLINDLSNIVKKINTTCINSNITPIIKQEMCLNKNNILNNYSSSDITKIKDFIVKYNDVIKSIKNISDNYLNFYLDNCNYDPNKINAYKDLQTTLSSTLFELSKTDTTLANTNNTLTSQNASLSQEIADLRKGNDILSKKNIILSEMVNTNSIASCPVPLCNCSQSLVVCPPLNLSTTPNKIIFFVGLGIISLIILILIFLLVRKNKETSKANLSRYSSLKSTGSKASILSTKENEETGNNKFRNMLFSGLKTLGNYV
jgi:hypothetical protein